MYSNTFKHGCPEVPPVKRLGGRRQSHGLSPSPFHDCFLREQEWEFGPMEPPTWYVRESL